MCFSLGFLTTNDIVTLYIASKWEVKAQTRLGFHDPEDTHFHWVIGGTAASSHMAQYIGYGQGMFKMLSSDPRVTKSV